MSTLHGMLENGSNYKKEGDRYYKDSLEQDDKYRQYLNQLSNIKTKLKLFYDEIDLQIARVSKLVENVIYQYDIVIKQVELEHQQQHNLLKGLTQSLDNLVNTELHPLLQEKTKKKNLHDFVNITQVRDILEKGKARVQEYQNLSDFGHGALKDMTTPQDEVTKKCSSLRSSLSEMLEQCPTDRDLNRPLISGLNDALSQLRNFREDLERMGRKLPLPDLQALPTEEEVRIRSKVLPGMKETYLKIEKNTLVARATVHEMKKYWLGGKECAKKLEVLSRTLTKQKRDDLERLKRAFIKLRMDEILFEEIRELTNWYSIFPNAYEMCLVEIVRRSEMHKKTQQRVEEMRTELHDIFQQEEDRRHQFVNEFGKYLPMNMLPDLVETTPRYTIPQNFRLNLPKIELSEEEIEEIKRRCSNNKNVQNSIKKNENGKQT